jgi:hypothetical protein
MGVLKKMQTFLQTFIYLLLLHVYFIFLYFLLKVFYLLLYVTCFFSAGDATVRLWPFTNAEDIKEITPLVLAQEEKDNVNVGHAPGKDVTALDWNVSLF